MPDKKLDVQVSPDGQQKTFTFELRLLCFETGAHDLGPVRVRITGALGGFSCGSGSLASNE